MSGKWSEAGVWAAMMVLGCMRICALPSDGRMVVDTMTDASGWVREMEGDPGNNILIDTYAWGRSVIRLWANTLDSDDSKAMKSVAGLPCDITELEFDVRLDASDTDLYICLQDFTGQWHESRLMLQDVVNEFQTVVVKTFAGGDDYSFYGGASDGLWHGPMINLGFRLRPGDGFPAGDQSRSVWVGEIKARTVRLVTGGQAMYLDDDEVMDLVTIAAASGVEQYRVNLRWQSVEPSVKGGYNQAYLNRYDDAFDLMAAYQMTPSALLIATPKWASAEPAHEYYKYFRPADWRDWDDFVNHMATRFGHQVYYWEGWNEANIVSEDLTGDPQDGGGHVNWFSADAEYVELLHRMRNGLSASGNRFKMMNGGWGLINGWDRVERFLSLGANAEIDIHNYHGYGDVYDPDGQVYSRSDFVQGLNSTYGLTNETWITEFGRTRGALEGGTNALEIVLQADYFDSYYYLHMADEALLPGDRFFLFCFPDKGWTTGSGENDWGLMTGGSNWVPTKAFYHWQSIGGVAETAFELLYHSDNTLSSLANGDYQTLTVRKRQDQRWDDPVLWLEPTDSVNAHLPVYVNNKWWYGDNEGLDVTALIEVSYLDVPDSMFAVTANGAISPDAYVETTGTYLRKTAVFTNSYAWFDDSQIGGADFDLTVKADAAALPVYSIRLLKDRSRGVVFEDPYYVKYLNFTDEDDSEAIGYSVAAHFAGAACRKIEGGHYLHFRNTRANVPTEQSELYITVEYFDNGAGVSSEFDRIKLWYNSPTSHYTANTELIRAQTGTWKTHTWHLTDAEFNWQTPAYDTDFKVGNNHSESETIYIRRVLVTDEKPSVLSPVRDLKVSERDGQFLLNWDSETDSLYQVFFRDHLTSGGWNLWLGDVAGTGGHLSVTGDVSDTQGFFRVMSE